MKKDLNKIYRELYKSQQLFEKYYKIYKKIEIMDKKVSRRWYNQKVSDFESDLYKKHIDLENKSMRSYNDQYEAYKVFFELSRKFQALIKPKIKRVLAVISPPLHTYFTDIFTKDSFNYTYLSDKIIIQFADENLIITIPLNRLFLPPIGFSQYLRSLKVYFDEERKLEQKHHATLLELQDLYEITEKIFQRQRFFT